MQGLVRMNMQKIDKTVFLHTSEPIESGELVGLVKSERDVPSSAVVMGNPAGMACTFSRKQSNGIMSNCLSVYLPIKQRLRGE